MKITVHRGTKEVGGSCIPPAPTAVQIGAVGRLASRWSIESVLIFFIIGAVLFYFEDEEKGKKEAVYLSDE